MHLHATYACKCNCLKYILLLCSINNIVTSIIAYVCGKSVSVFLHVCGASLCRGAAKCQARRLTDSKYLDRETLYFICWAGSCGPGADGLSHSASQIALRTSCFCLLSDSITGRLPCLLGFYERSEFWSSLIFCSIFSISWITLNAVSPSKHATVLLKCSYRLVCLKTCSHTKGTIGQWGNFRKWMWVCCWSHNILFLSFLVFSDLCEVSSFLLVPSHDALPHYSKVIVFIRIFRKYSIILNIFYVLLRYASRVTIYKAIMLFIMRP